MRVTPAQRVLRFRRAGQRKLFKSLHDSYTFVRDIPQSTSLPAPVLQTPATESDFNSMDTFSEGCDGKRVAAEKMHMSSSDALSFGSSELERASLQRNYPDRLPSKIAATSASWPFCLIHFMRRLETCWSWRRSLNSSGHKRGLRTHQQLQSMAPPAAVDGTSYP
jgi:hypothetical protein